MLLSLRKHGLTSLFKEVGLFKAVQMCHLKTFLVQIKRNTPIFTCPPGRSGLNTKHRELPFFGCGLLAYSWKLPAYSGAFSLTVDNFSFFTYTWSFFAYSFSFSAYSWSFCAYSGKVRLVRALRDCKQRSLTVSKKAPTSFPPFFSQPSSCKARL